MQDSIPANVFLMVWFRYEQIWEGPLCFTFGCELFVSFSGKAE